jgi:phosphopantothenoylcysteine decarboxylase/phosphopantothenate--cysteine ligase
VGFALQTGDDLAQAEAKRVEKGLDLVVVNRADEPDSGPEQPTNRITLLSASGAERLPLLEKREVAERICQAIESLL